MKSKQQELLKEITIALGLTNTAAADNIKFQSNL